MFETFDITNMVFCHSFRCFHINIEAFMRALGPMPSLKGGNHPLDENQYLLCIMSLACESLSEQFLFGRYNYNFGFKEGKLISIFSSFW